MPRPWGGEEDEGGAVKSMMRERVRVELGPSHMGNGPWEDFTLSPEVTGSQQKALSHRMT